MAIEQNISPSASPKFNKVAELANALAPITVQSEAALLRRELDGLLIAGNSRIPVLCHLLPKAESETDLDKLASRIAEMILPLRQLGFGTERAMEIVLRDFSPVLYSNPQFFAETRASDQVFAQILSVVGRIVSSAVAYAEKNSDVTAVEALEILGDAMTFHFRNVRGQHQSLNFQQELDKLGLAADYFEVILEETNVSIGEAQRIYQQLLSRASLYQVDPREIVGACLDQCRMAKAEGLSGGILLPNGCCSTEMALTSQSFLDLVDRSYFQRTSSQPQISNFSRELLTAIRSLVEVGLNESDARDLLIGRLLLSIPKNSALEEVTKIVPELGQLASSIYVSTSFPNFSINNLVDWGFCREISLALSRQFADSPPKQIIEAWTAIVEAAKEERGAVRPAWLGSVIASGLPIGEVTLTNEMIGQNVVATIGALNSLISRAVEVTFAGKLFSAVRPVLSQAADGNVDRTQQLGYEMVRLSELALAKGFTRAEFLSEVFKPVLALAFVYKTGQQRLSTGQLTTIGKDLEWLILASDRSGLLRLVRSKDVLRFILTEAN